MKVIKVLIPLAQGCEELEAVTIIDLLRRAEISVVTASLDSDCEIVVCSRGVKIQADTNLSEALKQNYDMVILPGGLPGADALGDDKRIIDLLVLMNQNGKYVAAICAAPKVLAKAGLLSNRKVTAYPSVLDNCEQDDFQLNGMVQLDKPVVIDANVITSQGPGTAIDFSLSLIELLTTRKKRDEVESALQRS